MKPVSGVQQGICIEHGESFSLATLPEYQYKTTLRVEGADTLNIYMCDLMNSQGLYGSAWFPDGLIDFPEYDGINMANPFSGETPYGALDAYITLVHEIGHWLGLYHTFEGKKCRGGGDFVKGMLQTLSKRVIHSTTVASLIHITFFCFRHPCPSPAVVGPRRVGHLLRRHEVQLLPRQRSRKSLSALLLSPGTTVLTFLCCIHWMNSLGH